MPPSTHSLERLSPADGPADVPPSELVHSVLRMVRIAQYRRRIILQAMLAAAVVGAVYYALAPRYFDSTAKLLIIQRNQDQLATVGDQIGSDSTMATHRGLVLSPVVLQEAVQNLLPEHRIDLSNVPPGRWADALAKNLQVGTTRKTNFINVSYRSLSPDAAAAVVSEVIHAYLHFIDRTHKGSAGDVMAVLTAERDQLRKTLAAKQDELRAFRQRVGQLALNSESHVLDPIVQRAIKLNDAFMEARAQRITLQASLAAVETAIQRGEDLQQYMGVIEAAVGRQLLIASLGLSPQDMKLVNDREAELLKAQTELQAMQPFYGASHPSVTELNDRIQHIQQYLVDYRANAGQRFAALGGGSLGPALQRLLSESVAQAWRNEQQLLASFEQARSEATTQSGELGQLETLEREVERLEAHHDVLFDKIASVDILQLQAPIQATVVQEPLPDAVPDSPQLRLVAVVSLLAGLLIGGLLAYTQDVLDDRFTSPDEMSAQLRVPILGIVRRLDPLDGSGVESIHTHIMPNAAETEAFRTLRTALKLSVEPTERLAVSSSEPGDGKTTVAANLAVAFAQAGRKTLVIDADLRKPGMTALMGLKGQPGVADVLNSADEPAGLAPRYIHHTAMAKLDVLPAGLRRPNPAELLSSENFVELLAWADSQYDQVLVDCPPVLAVSDAQIVGRLVDGAILVVRPEKNHRRLVLRACESFLGTSCNLLGVVVNGVSAGDKDGYGYGGYGGYGYGYGEEDDSEHAAADEETGAVNAPGDDGAKTLRLPVPSHDIRLESEAA